MKESVCFGITLLFLSAMRAYGLECFTGRELHSKDNHNVNKWNTIKCRSDVPQLCQRKDIIIVAFNFLTTTGITGECVNASMCDKPCSVDFHQVLAPEEEVPPPFHQHVVRKCEVSCCSTDNCNNPSKQTIKINATLLPSQPVKPPTSIESTTSRVSEFAATLPIHETESSSLNPPHSLTCLRGLEHEYFGQESWIFDECSVGMNYACIRQDVVLVVENRTLYHIHVGNCARRKDCEESCEQASTEELLSKNNITLMSCEQICCFEDNCNNRSVAQIQDSKGGASVWGQGGASGASVLAANVYMMVIQFIFLSCRLPFDLFH